ncbi:MAG: hypothetical protein Q7J45_03065 [bacterium]|nr:hypothetical protein [bacterium]
MIVNGGKTMLKWQLKELSRGMGGFIFLLILFKLSLDFTLGLSYGPGFGSTAVYCGAMSFTLFWYYSTIHYSVMCVVEELIERVRA